MKVHCKSQRPSQSFIWKWFCAEKMKLLWRAHFFVYLAVYHVTFFRNAIISEQSEHGVFLHWCCVGHEVGWENRVRKLPASICSLRRKVLAGLPQSDVSTNRKSIWLALLLEQEHRSEELRRTLGYCQLWCFDGFSNSIKQLWVFQMGPCSLLWYWLHSQSRLTNLWRNGCSIIDQLAVLFSWLNGSLQNIWTLQ